MFSLFLYTFGYEIVKPNSTLFIAGFLVSRSYPGIHVDRKEFVRY